MPFQSEATIQAHLTDIADGIARLGGTTTGNVAQSVDALAQVMEIGLKNVADAINEIGDEEEPEKDGCSKEVAKFFAQGVAAPRGTTRVYALVPKGHPWSDALLNLKKPSHPNLESLAALGDPEKVVDDLLARLKGAPSLPSREELLCILRIAHELTDKPPA
jgi:hypothetical protein